MKTCFARIALCASLAGGLLCATARGQQGYELKDGQWVQLAAPEEGTPEGELSLIRQHVEKRNGRRACRAARHFLERYPDDPACEEVMFLYGQAEMVRGRYFQAYEKFEEQFAQYPNGQYAERALRLEYDVAEAFLGGKRRIVLGIFYLPARDDGLAILDQIVEHVPASALAQKSLLRIADYHYQEQNYPEAAEAYDRFLELFKNSREAPYAMLQAARATYASFRDVRYEDTPLLDARQRFRTFRRLHADEAGRANVDRLLDRIEDTLARKSYETGKFYERIGRITPARYYYRLTVKEYPDTPWDHEARNELARLGAPVAESDKAPPSDGPAGPGRGEKP